MTATETGRRRRPSVVGIVGELLITAGVFIFLFLGWQLWLNDLVVGNAQRDDALALSRDFAADAPAPSPSPEDDSPGEDSPGEDGPEDDGDGSAPGGFGEPVVAPVVAAETTFANIYIPRFGADYVRTVSEGVGASTVLRRGVGHYPGTQMPGEVGNFALAAHRTTYGAPFNRIASLQVGDRIYVQTADGWYTYVFRSLEYVRPTGVGVLEPVPQSPGLAPTDRVLTMTSCNPLLSAAERIVAYSVFESWQPASVGAPDEVGELAGGGA